MTTICAAYAEDAALVPERTLRASLIPSFGFQFQKWEWEGVSTENVTFAGIGLGLEYGPAGWINFQALWDPGVNVYSKINGGDYGIMTDLFLGFKLGLFGKEALIQSEKTRLSVAAGMKTPLGGFYITEKARTVREPDQHLWGTVLRLYFDYVIKPFVTIDVYLEGVYYPQQWTYNPAYKTNMVNHPVDITPELEFHFSYPLPKSSVTLKGGLSATFFIAPVTNSNDDNASNQYRFSAGAYLGAAFAGNYEILARYHAPIAGLNTEPVHIASLVARFLIPTSR
jgi:hypothetical protein